MKAFCSSKSEHKKDSLHSESLLVPGLPVHVVRGNLPSIGHILSILLLLLLLRISIGLIPLSPIIVINLNDADNKLN